MKIKYGIWVTNHFGIVIEAEAEKVLNGYRVKEETVRVAGDGKLIFVKQESIIPEHVVLEVIDE